MSEHQKEKQLINELLKEAGYSKPKKLNIDYKWKPPSQNTILRNRRIREQRKERKELLKHEPRINSNLDQIRMNYHQLVKERGKERGLTEDQIQQVIRATEGEFMAVAIEKIFGKHYGAAEAFRE